MFYLRVAAFCWLLAELSELGLIMVILGLNRRIFLERCRIDGNSGSRGQHQEGGLAPAFMEITCSNVRVSHQNCE